MEQPKAMEYGSRKASPDILKPHIYIYIYIYEMEKMFLSYIRVSVVDYKHI
jgi:hypothetical protein